MEALLIALSVFAPLGGAFAALVAPASGLRAGRCVAAGCGVAAAGALAALVVSGTRDDGIVGELGGLDLVLDRSSALLLAVVMSTGVVVASFARRSIDLDPRGRRFFVLFGALVTASALVVVPSGAVALVIGWWISSWALIGLVGHRSELAETRRALRRTASALFVGDVSLLAAVLLIVDAGGVDSTVTLGSALDDLQSSAIIGLGSADVVAVLLVIAGASRSALFPFHRWLVATLAAPTPVSALVHAGFVSGAGLLAIRFGPLVLGSAVAVHLAFALAVLTVLVAVGAATTRVDVKGKLAWSTVAQMGFMLIQCTVGAFSSAVFHIAGHGMYKASQFLGTGDAVSAKLRSSRRAAPVELASRDVRFAASLVVPSVVLGFGLLVIPPDVADGGVILIAVFAWLTVAHGVWGWLANGVSAWPRSLAEASIGGLIAGFAYLAGLRAIEAFVEPTFGDFAEDSGVRPETLLATLAVVAVLAALARFARFPLAERVRSSGRDWMARTAHPAVAGDFPIARTSSEVDAFGGAASNGAEPVDAEAATKRSQIRADVARAANVIAPAWPLTSFVAVNPLGGLEQLDFDSAATVARHQLRARTHLSLDEYRRDHDRGLSTSDDLRWTIQSRFADVCARTPIEFDNRTITATDVIEADMLHGPDVAEARTPRTAVERLDGVDGSLGALINESIHYSVAHHVARVGPALGNRTFVGRTIRDAVCVAAIGKRLDDSAIGWLGKLANDPAQVIDAALAVMQVDTDDRVVEMRGQLSSLQGWAGYAKWRTEWAHADEARPTLTLIEMLAARCALEAAVLMSEPAAAAPSVAASDRSEIAARTVAVLDHLKVTPNQTVACKEVEEIVAAIGPNSRNEAWLHAQERCADRTMLTTLDRLDPGAPLRDAAAQLVFCIDVRSEGLRRNIEAAGPYDTIGFAGFFGAAMSAQRLEWQRAEARCPVLVSPSVNAVERPAQPGELSADVDRLLERDRQAAGAGAVHAQTKYGAGAPFVMAEAAGWIAGPVAAARTLLPTRAPKRSSEGNRPDTVMELERRVDGASDIEQRVFLAEAILRTMGLIDGFAPLVVLCGHTSANVNNAHGTALDCGACAGASGQDNARTVASLLNDVDVRAGLRDRGIDIPSGTSFAAGLHDTVGDTVDLLDLHLLSTGHREIARQLSVDLDLAAHRQSARRALDLPGPSSAVQRRGSDWAQVRPEWGLARNAAFIIGPRSMTAGLDLEGRAFLHTYDADSDPDGKVLETIMTAPLVVAHWISSQYYFSTVDPEVFGAGDKLIHNVVADTGVIAGESGDLRVGLPYQSTHIGSERHHQPVRLLAIIQAPLERIERIIDENPILATLTAGSWMRVAGRSHPHERWSLRTPSGTWSAEPRLVDTSNTLETT